MVGIEVALFAVQTIVVLVTAVFAWTTIDRSRDSRGIDFVIDAESTVDPMFQNLVGADPDLIRNIYAAYDLAHLTDLEVQAFPYMMALYGTASRITWLVHNDEIDIGLDRHARRELLELWLRSLAIYGEHPAMQVMHTKSLVHRDYNDAFLGLADAALAPKVERSS